MRKGRFPATILSLHPMCAPLQIPDQLPMLVRTDTLSQQSGSTNYTKEAPERQLVGACFGYQSKDSDATSQKCLKALTEPLLLAAAPTDIALIKANAEAGLALRVLIMSARREL